MPGPRKPEGETPCSSRTPIANHRLFFNNSAVLSGVGRTARHQPSKLCKRVRLPLRPPPSHTWEHSDSRSDPIEIDSRPVDQSKPRWRNGGRAGLRDSVSRDVPVRFWLEATVVTLWWNSRHTALRTQRLRTCGCNSCQGYQSMWVEAEVVQAEHCECSVSGCESRRSNQYHAVAERRGRRLQPVSRTFKSCRCVQLSG